MTRDEAVTAIKAKGATVIDDLAKSDDIEVMGWLLTVGLIRDIRIGITHKYVGEIRYEC